MNTKKAVLLLLVLGIAAGAAWFASGRTIPKAEHGEGAQGLTVYGNVDIRQVDLAFRVDGRLQTLAFEEGDVVQTGELAAALDPVPFEEEVAVRQAELAMAEAELQRLENGSRPQEIRAAEAAVTEREVSLANLEKEFDRRKALVDTGAVTRQSFDDIRARRDEARARRDSAQQELLLRKEGFRKEDIDKARAQAASRRAQLQMAQTRLDDTRLFAPSSGIVLTRVLEPGSIVRAGQAVLALSLSDPVWVRAYIPGPRLGNIHPGMKAVIHTDSRPDQPYYGHVGFISPEAEFTPKTVETPDLRTQLVYRFRIVVDNPDQGLRQGMPVTVLLSPQENTKAEKPLPGRGLP